MSLLPQLLGVACVGLAICCSSIHTIDQGFVGVYYRGGALLSRTSGPGFHTMLPIIDTVAPIQVTMQKDEVLNVPCGTSGGVMIHFEKIEVVNQLAADKVHDTVSKFGVEYDKPLLFDKVAHEVNQFCSSHTLHEVYVTLFDQVDEHIQTALVESLNEQAPGLQVLSVRVTKPKIPASIASNYEAMEAEKTRYLVVEQRQRVIEKESETEKRQAVIQAEKEAAVSKINSDKLVQQVLGEAQQEKTKADSLLYARQRDAEADKLRLTPEFLELRRIEELGRNTKIYFGPSIPTYYQALGAAAPAEP